MIMRSDIRKCSSHVETVDREDRSMKKHLMIVLLAASLAVTISGCQKQETEEKTFIGTDVLSGEGINYMVTTGK